MYRIENNEPATNYMQIVGPTHCLTCHTNRDDAMQPNCHPIPSPTPCTPSCGQFYRDEPAKEVWEERFDDTFILREFGIKCGLHSPCQSFDCVKSFIRQLLASERQRVWDEAKTAVLEMIPKKENINPFGITKKMYMENQREIDGFNAAHDKISALKNPYV